LGGRLALVCLDRELMERMNRADFDSDGLIDTLRSLDGIEVVAVLKERFDGSVKLSMRSKQDVDVQQIAASFGGGGHRKAAGASVPMSLREAAAAVEERVRAAVEGRA
ncbi:MAG TPA: DHHA1 domain-containing protein, partial [Burkholderiaceae bacterium]|nr:DHHA1 domain-containing protein [Burkholderiaceae bacterium]